MPAAALGERVRIVGAGPTGALLAILLRRRGLGVTIYESRPDPRGAPPESGRSINLALADRGIAALRRVGVFAGVSDRLVPMSGRLIHDLRGTTSLQPYGMRPDEVIYSISRHGLGEALLDLAIREHGVEVHFEHRLEAVDFATGVAHLRDLRRERIETVPMRPLLACDGAGSRLRREMQAAGLIAASEQALDHGYKELSIPGGAGGEYRMLKNALHIWPRGEHMLIALPNDDASFTATLFLPNTGAVSFASLSGPAQIESFLTENFPDVVPLMPDRIAEFLTHPTGFLGTVYADPWAVGGQAAIIGDAAHAIVPFHGQGMNCCLEDCLEFDACLDGRTDWENCFREFHARRKPNTDAIASMALENYLEMRSHVADAGFRLRSALALELERRFPQRFIPRYSMVMFHHEIPYATALSRGRVQARLLEELTAGRAALADVDFARAEREIQGQLEPLATIRSSVTNE
jgi:kynurenine 3-monooxygenase